METRAEAGVQCWRCPERPGLSLVCPACEALQPIPTDVDLFSILGLERRLAIDPEDLERRYHEASRLVHPDRHQRAGDRAQELSLTASATVNRAYRTLRDPVARGRYWLELHGMRLGDDANGVPPALAEIVFDTQEKLEELRSSPAASAAREEVEAIRDELGGRVDGLQNALRGRYAEWSPEQAAGPAALAELKRRLAEISYLGTLLYDVDATLGG